MSVNVNRHLQNQGYSREQEKCADGALGTVVFAPILVGLGTTNTTEVAATEAEPHTGKQDGQE